MAPTSENRLRGLSGESTSRFELIREIGSGGTGTVFLARQRPLDREVALKVLGHQWAHDAATCDAFVREAAEIAGLRHRSIIKIHDVGFMGKVPFISMEYHAAGSLADRPLPISPAAALRVIADVASALVAAHAAGIVHGDIKPGNVLCHEDGGYVLTDFGVASLAPLGTHGGAGRMVAGTPGFMSPERWRGAALTPACDVFGLGALLYFLLTARVVGEVPNSDPLATEVEPLSTVPMLPEALSALQGTLATLLAPDPSDRLPDASAAAAQIASLSREGLLASEGSLDVEARFVRKPRTSRVLREWPHGGLEAFFEPRRARLPSWLKGVLALAVLASTTSALLIFGLSEYPQPKAPPVLVVLPFSGSVTGAERDLAAVGIADAVRSRMAQESGVRVWGSGSSARVPSSDESALDSLASTGATHVLAGEISVAGDEVRVRLRLRSLVGSHHVKEAVVTRPVHDFNALPFDIVRFTGASLGAQSTTGLTSSSNQRRIDGAQYLMFLEARTLVERTDVAGRKRALDMLRTLVSKAPSYAPAFIQLSATASRLAETEPDRGVARDLRMAAIEAARTAVALDPGSPEALAERGIVRLLIERNWELAHQDIDAALKMRPNEPEVLRRFGLVRMAAGDMNGALDATLSALALDPLDVRTIVNAARMMMCVGGRDREAASLLERAVALAPDAHSGRFNLGLARLLIGDSEGARHEFDRIPPGIYLRAAGLAIEARARGDSDAAAPHIAELQRPGRTRPYALALAAIAGGDPDTGLRLLAAPDAAGEDWIAAIQGEPLVRHLRDDPRLRALVEDLGFPFGQEPSVPLVLAAPGTPRSN